MRKAVVALFLSLFFVSASMAQVFIGSRHAGMGGTGVASAVGLNAIAYNPAGLMDGAQGEFLLSLGAANQGMDKIINSLTATSPSQFLLDNYSNSLDANGSLSGILGFNVNKVGISVLLPSVTSVLSKGADSLAGSYNSLGTGAVVLTLGHSFSIPGVPIGSLDVGANIKSIYSALGNISVAGDPTAGSPVSATQTYWVGSGAGYDAGAKTTVEIPMVADFSVGVALRNISQTIKYKPKTRLETYTFNPTGNPTLSSSPEAEGAETEATYPAYTVIGCAGTIPGIGLKFAADIETVSGGTGALAIASDTVTHLGVEYPVYVNTLILRAGTASGQNTSVTTLGAKINIPFLTLEIANVIDAKNTKNTSYVIDAGVAF